VKYRICWKAVTGEDGHGDWFGEEDKRRLEYKAGQLNKKHEGEFSHWVEEQPGEVPSVLDFGPPPPFPPDQEITLM